MKIYQIRLRTIGVM